MRSIIVFRWRIGGRGGFKGLGGFLRVRDDGDRREDRESLIYDVFIYDVFICEVFIYDSIDRWYMLN